MTPEPTRHRSSAPPSPSRHRRRWYCPPRRRGSTCGHRRSVRAGCTCPRMQQTPTSSPSVVGTSCTPPTPASPMFRCIPRPTWSTGPMAATRFGVLPGWANPFGGTTWAPSVHQIGSTYNMYFTALDVASRIYCVGVATAASPHGPFVAQPRPMVCETGSGEAIDPYLFTDDGAARYLIYKTDANCCSDPTRIWSQRLTGDGLGLIGGRSELLRSGAAWEAGVIEGPTMVKRGGRYHLLYSANRWNTHYYAVGHAVCEGINGPCYRSSELPFMGNRGDGVGFGGPSVWESPNGEVWMVYHGWFGPGVGYEHGGVRAAWGHRLDFPDWLPPPPPPRPRPRSGRHLRRPRPRPRFGRRPRPRPRSRFGRRPRPRPRFGRRPRPRRAPPRPTHRRPPPLGSPTSSSGRSAQAVRPIRAQPGGPLRMTARTSPASRNS